MSDPLINATNKAKAKKDGIEVNISESFSDAVTKLKNRVEENLNNKLNKLSLDKNPVLIARQKAAEALEIKAKVSEIQLINKDQAIEVAKEAIRGRIFAALPSIPKLPVLDKKILDGLALAKQLKKLYKERNKVSKENLKKGKELYTYPMEKVEEITIEDPFPRTRIAGPSSSPRLPFRNE